MNRVLVLSGLVLWGGATLLLSELRWFARPGLADRLRPYIAGGATRSHSAGFLSAESFREAVGPLCHAAGERLSRLLGVTEKLEVRLTRLHSDLDVTAFRVRQLGWSLGGFGLAALMTAAVRPPTPVLVLSLIGAPILAFLVLEQRVASASEAHQRRLFLELPVIAEQLALLLSAGYSLTSALNRIAERGDGVCARDLRRVCMRLRQGVGDVEALREWAAVADVEAVSRLVPVLALNRETTDLGRLISEEARSVRREGHRRLVEAAERRNQQVWIPVTVATLLPGAVFMGVPFIEALRMFGQ